MKIFDKDGKINFVDENNVVLGYDMDSQCCEKYGWFISDIQLMSIPDEGKEDSEKVPNLEQWVFDKSFMNVFEFDTNWKKEDETGHMAVFRIVNGNSEKFIHLYNCHNGYYSHGFDFMLEKKEL